MREGVEKYLVNYSLLGVEWSKIKMWERKGIKLKVRGVYFTFFPPSPHRGGEKILA